MRLTNALQSTMIPENRPRRKESESPLKSKLSQLLTLPNAIRILKTYRWISLGIFGVVLGLVVLAINLVPATYESEAKLFVRVGRESVALDPTATTGQTISVYESRENEINSVVDVLQSRGILERIVSNMASELIAESPKEGTNYSKQQLDNAVRGLGQSIAVSHSKKSSVITITTKAKSPELAQRILDDMLRVFREQHFRINRTMGSYEFFEEQWKSEKQELETARNNLKEAKNTFGLASVEGHRKNLEAQISATETSLMQNQRSLTALNAEIVALQTTMDILPQRIPAQEVTGFFNDAAEGTREQIQQLEIEHRQLLTKYTARHPYVRIIKSKIDAGKAILQEQRNPKNQMTTSNNPQYQQVQLNLITNQARRVALEAEKVSLNQQLETLSQKLKELNANEAKLAGLEESIELHRTSVKAYG
ncbi:MAG: hypothetical protein KDA84_23315 [Planctomycetaceae bacterium]|nr:hypothetical protein [Planctomycetaceae bacterium]